VTLPESSSERRYEIRALIGPCTRDEAENAAELVLESLEDDLGPSVSLEEWREDEPCP